MTEDLDSKIRREVLLAAIADIQSSVKANDAKCSAALVVHGLLFAGLVTVASRLGPTYEDASGYERTLIVGLLALTLIAFGVSVFFLLRAMRPYRPKNLGRVDEWRTSRYPGVFFPGDLGDRTSSLHLMRKRVEGLNHGNVTDELGAEVVKLVNILGYESRNATRGYWALFAEVLVAGAFLVHAGILAG